MPFLALLGIGLLITVLVLPWIAFSKAGKAETAIGNLESELRALTKRLNDALAKIAVLQKSIDGLQSRELQSHTITLDELAPVAKNAAVTPPPVTVVSSIITEPVIPPPINESVDKGVDDGLNDGLKDALDDALTRYEWTMPTAAPNKIEVTQPLPPVQPTQAPVPRTAPRPVQITQPPVPIEPYAPSDFEVRMGKWITAAKEWLFGGNLVAKVGLLILFIGVAFLVRLAANYVTVPVEVRLAGVAASAIALLVWGWRIRDSRRGIALPVQGAALAILMLVTFGAFKLFHVLPSGATFVMLFVLVAFTCILAVLQDAIWLAIFGIAGGFAAPVLVSTGGGSHIALFSYYSLLNAGVLAIALKRSWRALNLLGFAFTFIVGAAWGEQRYIPDNYYSSQIFLIVFWLFYIAIATLFAWRRAPQLKSYVDGTLVFGVPMAGMALQYGLVKDIPYGMSISALSVALTYATTASVLWRWRQGNLRLLVESFLALAIVFGTLAIPLAFDGRWTSAAWAVEGAAIVWVGLRQKQKLAWQFGVAVQLSSWVSFLSALTGLNPLSALRGNVGLGFLLLGGTGVLMALMFRRHMQNEANTKAGAETSSEEKSRQRFSWMASGFISVAVLWLLLGMWVEVWLRMEGAQRASMLVFTALALVFSLQFLSRKSSWRLPDVLGGGVAGVAGIVFVVLMFKHMDWKNFAIYPEHSFGELLTNGPLLGGLMLCAGALVSAFAFKHRLATMTASDVLSDIYGDASTTAKWLLIAVFWWCGFALHGIAHAVAYLTSANNTVDAVSWYSVSFWGAYSIGLSLSALAWSVLAVRKAFPNPRWMLLVFWPALTALGAFAFWKQVSDTVWWLHRWQVDMPMTMSDAWLTLLSGPLAGALILCGLAWHAIFRIARGAVPAAKNQSDAGAHGNRIAISAWVIGLGLIWYAIALDALALFIASTLNNLGTPKSNAWWQLGYAQVALLLFVVSGMSFLQLAKHKQLLSMRWLAIPTAVWQAMASATILGTLYLQGKLPSVHIAIAMLGCWLGMAWCLRYWQRNEWRTSSLGLRALHFGRVIAPWLAIAPLVSLGSWRWLVGETPQQISTLSNQDWSNQGWVVAGMWPDYLAAWISIASLLVLLRQVKSAGWPLRPLHEWYGKILIPLATLWAVLLAIYWNLRQDGNMSPLPYLPLLNPLDITTGFVALLVAMVWQADKSRVVDSIRINGIKLAMALAFGWFNLMLLRTAAHYLHLPYRFSTLYASQFVQAMLSIVWTLTAFMLMRYAVRKLSKPLWMVGAALLAVVVAKLALVDLSNSGSVARIVSFMGVGGLMLVIGYLAPLPRSEADSADKETT